MTANFKDQLKEIKKEVIAAERAAPKYDMYDAIEDVLDLQGRHALLFVGSDTTFPSMKRFVRSTTFAPKSKELNQLVDDGTTYDRIFFSRNSILAESSLRKAVSLLSAGGLLCFFTDNEELRGMFCEAVEGLWPTAETWTFKSNVGPVVVTNAAGPVVDAD